MLRSALWSRIRVHALLTMAIMVSFFIGMGPFFSGKVYGAQRTSRTLLLNDSQPGAHNVTYNITFTAGSSPVSSIAFQFCSDSSLYEDACTAPYGFDVLNANIVSQSGTTGFIKSPSSDVSDIILTREAPTNFSGPVNFTFDGVVNPTYEGSYFIRILTFGNSSATGTPTDYGAMAFPINKGFDVSAEVPPYLTFCTGRSISGFDCSSANGDLVDFGEFSSATSSSGSSQVLAATNAGSGYSIYVNGTTMTSGNNIIPAMANTTSQVGTSQFGLNLRANSSPQIGQDPQGPGTGGVTANYNQPNRYRFVNNEAIASAAQAQDYKKYTISYVVNVSKDQSPGVYSTTLTYVCIANF